MKFFISLLFLVTFAFANSQDGDAEKLINAILASNPAPAPADTRAEIGASDPEINMSAAEIATYWGYPAELYPANTEDGYELTLIRIPHGRFQEQSKANAPQKKPVVFLQHGLDGSAADWVTNLPNEAAAFVFADSGFDVWMGNFRGNKYAKFHKTLSPKEHAFWQFSWDEMAKYDLPAMINLALNVSKSDKLYYVGFSLGTTTAFAKFSQDLELGKKIKKFYALAPMATVKHIKGPLKYFATFTGTWETIFKIFGVDEFAPSDWVMNMMAKYFCGTPVVDLLCTNVLFLIGGPDSKQMNATRVPVYLSHSPGGTSSRTMIHMGQMVKSGKFQAYDYGKKKENREHYGQDKPPEYDVSKMEVPVAIYSGGEDWLSDPKDVQNLVPKLKNMFNNVYLPEFSDFDFIWGLHAAPEVYWPIRNDIKEDFGK